MKINNSVYDYIKTVPEHSKDLFSKVNVCTAVGGAVTIFAYKYFAANEFFGVFDLTKPTSHCCHTIATIRDTAMNVRFLALSVSITSITFFVMARYISKKIAFPVSLILTCILLYHLQSLRGESKSTVEMAEKNFEELKAQNAGYEEELKRLAPISMRISKLVELATSLQKGFTVESDAIETATIVAEYVQKTLNDPMFIQWSTITEERMEMVSARLDAAVKKLETIKKVYEEKLQILSDLMEEYQQLGGEYTEQMELIKRRTEEIIKQQESNIQHVYTTVFVN